MSDSADDIVQRMQGVRHHADANVQEIRESAKTLFDWRYYVKNHPWMCLGAAAAVGFLIVPRRKTVPSEDAKELVELLKKHNLNAMPMPGSSKGLTATLIGLAAPLAMRAASQAAQQYFADGTGPLASILGGMKSHQPAAGEAFEPTDEQSSFEDFNIPR